MKSEDLKLLFHPPKPLPLLCFFRVCFNEKNHCISLEFIIVFSYISINCFSNFAALLNQGHPKATAKITNIIYFERNDMQMTEKQFFYGRISAKDQNEERQLLAAREFGIDERDIYLDKQSGKDFDREQYQLMKGQLRQGDLVVIMSIDRLGRNYDQIISEWRDIVVNLGCDIVVLDMPLLDTRNEDGGLTKRFISDLFLQILSYVAEQERINIRSRQRQGIEIAKAAGKYKGRKPIATDDFPQIYEQWKAGMITARKGMELLNIKANTFYRRVKQYEGTL